MKNRSEPFVLHGSEVEMGEQLRAQLLERRHDWEEAQRQKGVQGIVARFGKRAKSVLVEWRYMGCNEEQMDEQWWAQPVHEFQFSVSWDGHPGHGTKFETGWVVGTLSDQAVLDGLCELVEDCWMDFDQPPPYWVIRRLHRKDKLVVDARRAVEDQPGKLQ